MYLFQHPISDNRTSKNHPENMTPWRVFSACFAPLTVTVQRGKTKTNEFIRGDAGKIWKSVTKQSNRTNNKISRSHICTNLRNKAGCDIRAGLGFIFVSMIARVSVVPFRKCKFSMGDYVSFLLGGSALVNIIG